MTSSLHQQVRRTIRRHALCPPGTRVLIALSGGSDSVAMMWLLRDLADAAEFKIAGLAHLNHELRSTADRDQEFCRDLATRAGLPIVVSRRDVKAYAASERLSVEDAARRLRYAFLSDAAAELSATRIAVGHTLDDQAETFLLKLVRGAGATGLAGVFPSHGTVIRPLLDVSRAALREWLDARGERWVEDETNADLSNPRNRARHVVIPQLEQAFGPAVPRALARAAALIRDDGEWLDMLAARVFDGVISQLGDGVEVDAEQLKAQPQPLARRVLRAAMRRVAGGREIGLDHVEAALDVLSGSCTGADVPGGRWELRGQKLVLLHKASLHGPDVPFSYPLPVPGEAAIPEAGCLIGTEATTWEAVRGDATLRAGKGNRAIVALRIAEGLRVRNRRPGDRIRPPGLDGRKKLQDLFVDAGVPRSDRERVPVVVDQDDRIIWVPEHTVSADFLVSGAEGAVILLKLTRLGGKA